MRESKKMDLTPGSSCSNERCVRALHGMPCPSVSLCCLLASLAMLASKAGADASLPGCDCWKHKNARKYKVNQCKCKITEKRLLGRATRSTRRSWISRKRNFFSLPAPWAYRIQFRRLERRNPETSKPKNDGAKETIPLVNMNASSEMQVDAALHITTISPPLNDVKELHFSRSSFSPWTYLCWYLSMPRKDLAARVSKFWKRHKSESARRSGASDATRKHSRNSRSMCTLLTRRKKE